MSPPPSPTSVRPPYADELPRLRRHFAIPLRNPPHGRLWLWVLVAGEFSRLVGVAALEESTGTQAPAQATEGRLQVDLRPAWGNHPAADTLFTTALDAARALGLRTVTTTVDAGSPLFPRWTRLGFTETARYEVWKADLAEVLAEHATTGARILQRLPVPIFPVRPQHLDPARRICGITQLLPPERVQPRSPNHPEGIDPNLSFYAGNEESPGAVVLCREVAAQLYLEVLARDPRDQDLPLSASVGLLHAAVTEAVRRGYEELRCTVRPDLTRDLLNLLRRGGGVCLQTTVSLRQTLPAQVL